MLIGCWIESAELNILGHDQADVLWCVVMFDDVLFYHSSSRGRLCEKQRPRRNSMPWTVCPIVELNPRTETDSESKNYQQVVFFAYILYIYVCNVCMYVCMYIYYNIAPVSWCESGLPWGVEWWKVWFYKVLHHYAWVGVVMRWSCYISNKIFQTTM